MFELIRLSPDTRLEIVPLEFLELVAYEAIGVCKYCLDMYCTELCGSISHADVHGRYAKKLHEATSDSASICDEYYEAKSKLSCLEPLVSWLQGPAATMYNHIQDGYPHAIHADLYKMMNSKETTLVVTIDCDELLCYQISDPIAAERLLNSWAAPAPELCNIGYRLSHEKRIIPPGNV